MANKSQTISVKITPTEAVKKLYEIILKRAPDSDGFSVYTDLIRSKKLTGVFKTAEALINSEEFFLRLYEIIPFIVSIPIEKMYAKYNKRLIVFYHIWKTAGTSVYKYLKNIASEKKLNISFTIHSIETLVGLPVIYLHTLDILSGHIDVETVHMIYGSRRPLFEFTILRDPTERLRSLYNFWHAHDYKDNPEPHIKLANELPPEQFYSHPHIQDIVWNQTLFHILGKKTYEEIKREYLSLNSSNKKKFVKQYLHPLIKKAIRSFDFVGIQEDLDQSLQILATLLKSTPPKKAPKVNVTKKDTLTKPGFRKIKEFPKFTQKAVQVIQPLIELDTIVYEEGKKRYKYIRKKVLLKQKLLKGLKGIKKKYWRFMVKN